MLLKLALILVGVLSIFMTLSFYQPSFLVGALFSQTVLLVYCAVVSNMFMWLGYVLILLFWGSVMILFLYCLCLSPNPKPVSWALPEASWKLIPPLMLALTLFVTMSMSGLPLQEVSAPQEFGDEALGSSLVSKATLIFFLFTVLCLLVILLVVCEMSRVSGGPLILRTVVA